VFFVNTFLSVILEQSGRHTISVAGKRFFNDTLGHGGTP
jgi:hypothetical protein